MKKLLLIAALLSLITAAQCQEWKQRAVAADELRGTKADTLIYYSTEKFIVLLSKSESTISVITKEGIFNTGGLENTELITVGLYDTIGNLVERLSMCGFGILNDRQHLIIKDYQVKMFNSRHPDNFMASRIKDYMLNSEGCVRFVLPRYMKHDLDITVPTAQRMFNK